MPRPTQDKWLAARQAWESNPLETFESIGKSLGVSRVAASKRAAKEGWSRPQNLRQIVEKAQLKADAKVTPKPREVSDATGKTTEQAAVDVRADLLEQHRSDWLTHRNLFGLDEIRMDFNIGKQAKISAEMLLLRQKGERDAYGLSTADVGKVDEVNDLSDEELNARIRQHLHRFEG